MVVVDEVVDLLYMWFTQPVTQLTRRLSIHGRRHLENDLWLNPNVCMYVCMHCPVPLYLEKCLVN
jgi:hypothetical protein